ncbi:sorting nexin-13-like [Halichondria panicea]|uniref:sorting nexin-13-like n=1 Tax=Halichondria panicea TaxID=6063 RepID=UPI00312B8E1F
MDGGLLLVLCVLSFILGFLSVALYVSWQQACHVRKLWTESSPQWTQVGCHKVLAPSVEPRPLQFNSQLTGVRSIDEELEKLLSLGLRDLFESWYHTHVSPDPVCSQEALKLAHNVIQEVAAAGREVDYLAFFIETLMNDFMDHLRAYKVACGTASVGVVTGQSAAIWNEAVETEFFKCESGEDPWRAVCCDREARIAYLYRLSELLLCIVLPEDEFSSPSLQALLTDVLVWKVWTPLLKTLALPDNINTTFISMCKESSLNTDSFMAALSEGANETEVRSLRYNVNSHISHLQKTGVTDYDRLKKSALESVLATAKAVLSAKSVPANVSSDSLIALSAAIPDYTIQSEGTTKHCVFHVNVSCKHSHVSVTEKWIIDRRYRDFHDLHLSLRAQIDNFPANLVLPTLPSFHKLDPQRLDVRRIQLEGYLKTITSEEFLSDHLDVLGQVILFLSEGEYERQSTELKRMANTLLNPLKRVATLTRGALKSSGQSSSKMSPVTVKKQPSSETPKPPGEEDEDSLPVDIMLILLDELFDLRADSQWLRRQLPTLLKQLVGDKLSRKVVGYSDWFVSSEQVACYLRDFRATMWPNGQLAPSKPQQSVELKALRSLMARAKLIGSIPDEMKRFIGTDTSTKGMAKLFGMFQSDALNIRLVLLLLEGLLDTLFPNRNLKQTFLILRTEIAAGQRTGSLS